MVCIKNLFLLHICKYTQKKSSRLGTDEKFSPVPVVDVIILPYT